MCFSRMIIIAQCIWLFGTAGLNAADIQGTVFGLNVDADGNTERIADVTVTVRAGNDILARALTDRNGNYRVEFESRRGPVILQFTKEDRVTVTLDLLSGETVGGRIDVVEPVRPVGVVESARPVRDCYSLPCRYSARFWRCR